MKPRLGTGPVGTAALGFPGEQSSTGFTALMKRAVMLLMSALREIFDESAYIRFLKRRHMVSSREAYSAFCREYEATTARRPKCC
jgi:hypothetical protein